MMCFGACFGSRMCFGKEVQQIELTGLVPVIQTSPSQGLFSLCIIAEA